MAGVNQNWWIGFRSPFDIYENHATYLALELITYTLTVLTLSHALRNGGRYPYLWIATVFHGITVESVSYFMPDIDNFWHAQSMIMFLGRRLPLHIMFFYPVFLYTAAVAASRLKLRTYAEPFMMGLAVVLLDVPFDIMGIKLLWWTWHDTEPNIYDRHMWVPWNSYYFHATFACSFHILFHGSRRLFTSTKDYKADNFFLEMICCIIPGLFAFAGGALQFIPIYHVLHDNFSVHTEICVLSLIALYALIIWTSDRRPTPGARLVRKRGWFDEIGLFIFIHYPFYILLSIFGKPENVRSIGLHEPVGDCNAAQSMTTALGQVLYKKKFLCASNYDEGYFDWHCRPDGKPPANGSEWYEACGTAFPNHAEYVVVVTMFALVGFYIYYQMIFKSGGPIPATQPVVVPFRKSKHKTK